MKEKRATMGKVYQKNYKKKFTLKNFLLAK